MKDWQNEKDQPHHDPTARVVRAAEYVRMSTDHQKYSTENQADAIRHYASSRGIEIVSTYADDGKSGLSIDGRASLLGNALIVRWLSQNRHEYLGEFQRIAEIETIAPVPPPALGQE